MGLKETIREKSKAQVRRETITLPRCGEKVTIRGLMAGEQLRIAAAPEEKQGLLFAAMGVEEEEGKNLWNANDLNDMNDIASLHGDDLTAILKAVERISGVAEGKEGGKGSAETKSSGSSSASDTESPPTLSAVA